jgi:hypothetical protein
LLIRCVLEHREKEGKRTHWEFLPLSLSSEITEEQSIIWRVHCQFVKEKVRLIVFLLLGHFRVKELSM